MKTLLFIACGGAFGAVMRYAATHWVYAMLGRGFPYATLFVNVSGSLLLGLLSVFMLERLNVAPEWRAAMIVGVLGSFTTFSTFSLETFELLEQGNIVAALLNVFLSVLVCLLAVWLGVVVARLF